MKCRDARYFALPQVNIGCDVTEMFLGQVLSTATICRQHILNKIPMKRLTQEQWREYNTVRNCSISTRPFKVADKNVLDHDHLTGKYRSSAHNACNLNYGINPKKMKILCIVHNLKDIFSMLQLFSLLLVFETHFDSYFMILILIAIFYLHQFLQVKVVSVIL